MAHRIGWRVRSDRNRHRELSSLREDDPTRDNSIRSGTTLIPFDQELRLRISVVEADGKTIKALKMV